MKKPTKPRPKSPRTATAPSSASTASAKRSKATSDPHSSQSPSPKPPPPPPPPDSASRSIDLLTKVRNGTLNGRALGTTERQAVVALLVAEGCSAPEMAQVLDVSDRTIERDRRQIRESNALPKDPRLVDLMVGRLVAESELATQRIRKAIREKDVDPAVRVDGEHRCYQINSDLFQRLQQVGYLPTAAHQVHANLVHHAGSLPEYHDLVGEMERLACNAEIVGADLPELNDARSAIDRATIATTLQQLKHQLTAASRPEIVTEQRASSVDANDK